MGERFEKDKARMEADAAKRRIHFSVTFPGKIIESNATRVEGKTAIWEYKLSEMQKLEGRLPELTARVRH